MQRFLRWTVPIAIAIMFLGAFSPTNLAAANAVSGDHNVATINNVGSAADQLIALNTDSNLVDPNQKVLLRSDGHDGQTQQVIAMDNDGCGTQVASTKGNFEGMWTALMATHRHVGHQQIAYGNSSGLQHLQANTGATFNGTRQQYAMGIATTFNPPGRQQMAALNETWTDGHLAWRDDANMGGAAMAATGHHRLRALRQSLGFQQIVMMQPASMGQQLQL